MATRSCPNCGVQYVASVRRCIDCDVLLVDDVDDTEAEASSASVPLGEGDQIAYELETWGNQLKVSLEGMLERAAIARVWEAGALVVSAADEQAVDELIAFVEGTEVPELAEDAEQIAFEIEDLDIDGQNLLDARLIAESVPHAWSEEGELLVAAEDEERVQALIEEVLDGDIDGADALAASEALSALYVAADRLQKKPHDDKLADAVAAAAKPLPDLGVPYGFSAEDWDSLLAEVEGLVAALGRAVAFEGDVPDRIPLAEDLEADAEAAEEFDAEHHIEHAEPEAAADEADEDADGEDDTDEDVPDLSVKGRATALRNRLFELI